MHMKKAAAFLLAVLMAGTLLVSCKLPFIGELGTDSSKQEQNDNSEQAKEKTFVTTDGKYQITAPDNWGDLKGQLGEGALLEVGNGMKEQYLLVMEQSKADVQMTLQEYADAVKTNLENSNEGTKIGTQETLTIDGKQAICIPFESMVNKVNVRYWIYNVEWEDTFMQVHTWTLKSKGDEYQQLLRAAAESLKAVASDEA